MITITQDKDNVFQTYATIITFNRFNILLQQKNHEWSVLSFSKFNNS